MRIERRTLIKGGVPRPKVTVPVPPREFTPRARPAGLLPRGDDDDEPLVTLVCAPAGFGKTTLLSAWARQLRSEPVSGLVAWLTVEETDNDPAALFAGVVSAIGSALAVGVVGNLPHPGVRKNDLVAAVADLVEVQDRRVWLVLDDIDQLHSREALEVIALLVRGMPRNLRLIFSGRREPRVALHRVHLAGRLREIRARDLQFTEEEAREAVTSLGVEIAEGEIRGLIRCTWGWPAAIRLIALALAATARDATIGSVVVTDRAIASFLETEVLSELSSEQREMLLCTCVGEEFDTDLAMSLTERAGAADILDLLRRFDGLVSRSHDGRRYCLQPFVRTYLRAKLERQSSARFASLNGVAAVWHREKRDPVAAARFAAHSADFDLITDLLAVEGPGLLLRGELELFRALADALPADSVARADVGLTIVLGDLTLGNRVAAELRLSGLAGALASTTTQRERDLELIVRTHWARLTGQGGPRTVELSYMVARTSSADLLVFALVNRGTTAFWLGDHAAADHDLDRALQVATSSGFDLAVLHCLSHLGGVSAASGDYPQMQRVAEQALRFAQERGDPLNAASCLAFTVAAWAAYQFLDRNKAREFAAKAVELLGANNDRTVELSALSVRDVVEFEYGDDPHSALVHLREVWQGVSPTEVIQPSVLAYEAVAENRMALRLGLTSWAAEGERRITTRTGASGEALLLRARLHSHYGRVGPARAQLERITSGRTPCLARPTRIEAHLLAATLAERGDDQKTAQTQLVAAIELAEPIHALRPFFEAGEVIRQLLVSQLGRLGRLDAFAERVVEAIPAEQPGVAAELTPREVQLLRELPSLATIEEIAGTLYVSANTIKTHLRNLYRKLGVASRREAVIAARQRGLL